MLCKKQFAMMIMTAESVQLFCAFFSALFTPLPSFAFALKWLYLADLHVLLMFYLSEGPIITFCSHNEWESLGTAGIIPQ